MSGAPSMDPWRHDREPIRQQSGAREIQEADLWNNDSHFSF